MGAVFRLSVLFEYAADCIVCGIPIALSDTYIREKKRNHSNWYCPNGHPQHWPQKSDIEIANEKLALANRNLEYARSLVADRDRQISAKKGEITKLKNRVRNGVCPCCNRSFQNLRRHMATKHPELKNEEG